MTSEGGRPSARQPFEPAYVHIVRTVTERIARGEYRPGDQLPSESQFCSEFSVSPMTLRRAIGMLVDRRLVVTAQGKGTFVRSLELGEAVFRLQQLTDRWQDSSIEVRMLEAAIVPAEPEVARAMQLIPGERTVLLRRLFRKHGRPFMYHKEHVAYDPRRPWVESQLSITSLDGLLHSTGGQGIARAELSISAVNLEQAEAAVLEVSPGAAAFSLEHLFRDYEDAPVSWGWFLCRPDEFRLVTQLGAGT